MRLSSALALLLASTLTPGCADPKFGSDDTGTPTDDGNTLANYLVVEITGTVVIGTHSEPSCTSGKSVVDEQPYTTYYEVNGGTCTTTSDDYFVEVHVSADDGAYHFTTGIFAYEIDPRYDTDH